MMATNVTQKDKTLNEIIAWADQLVTIECETTKLCVLENDVEGEMWHDGLASAYQNVVERCKSMLGYGR